MPILLRRKQHSVMVAFRRVMLRDGASIANRTPADPLAFALDQGPRQNQTSLAVAANSGGE
jgi:hypothetical protein